MRGTLEGLECRVPGAGRGRDPPGRYLIEHHDDHHDENDDQNPQNTKPDHKEL